MQGALMAVISMSAFGALNIKEGLLPFPHTDGSLIYGGQDQKYAAVSTSAGASTNSGARPMGLWGLVDDNKNPTLARNDCTTSSVSSTRISAMQMVGIDINFRHNRSHR